MYREGMLAGTRILIIIGRTDLRKTNAQRYMKFGAKILVRERGCDMARMAASDSLVSSERRSRCKLHRFKEQLVLRPAMCRSGQTKPGKTVALETENHDRKFPHPHLMDM